MNKLQQRSNRAVAYWLLIGVGMIMVQVLLGGITRLTESGLSITEWKPITGALPPLNDAQWQLEFDKYKNTSQFKYVHSGFTLSDFKFIFFWEWFHRVWARLLGVVFIIGFGYFIWKKSFKREMILPLVILFFLGAVQGAIGWVMVASGLVPEKYFVGHVQLATHFIAALILLVYTLWFAFKMLIPENKMIVNGGLKTLTLTIILLLFVQLTYGAFMAGLHAGPVAPTWPTINGEWFPHYLFNKEGLENYTGNAYMVQFIHRGLAYLLTILIIIWFVKASRQTSSSLFNQIKWLPLLLVLLQVVLGVLTVVNSPISNKLVMYGVLHQAVAMLLLVSLVWVYYVIKAPKA
ncbi:COX15/CtaA family protein [Danxiaibacter flavus]|uniref:COX15/CtaA family protein n=1 Tax=Danxiaibacter flavus TaxID=3049108 RepID=A0ABV3ZIC4_9BACT|nr:COX15/CtaA family protein [Chitinophagaceae bacterium DXS]